MNKETHLDLEFYDKTPLVNSIERDFYFNGISNPSVWSSNNKNHLLFDENKVLVIAIDTVRCATTACKVLDYGAKLIRVYDKTNEDINKLYEKLNFHNFEDPDSCVCIGEYAGKAMPQGLASNSPNQIHVDLVKDKKVLFLSKNLGSVCSSISKSIFNNLDNWHGEFIICCLLNVDLVIEFIKEYQPKRIVFACGGFRKTESIEDLYTAGLIIDSINSDLLTCDDVAISMYSIFKLFASKESLFDALKHTRVAKVLHNFGMESDIFDCILSSNINSLPKFKIINNEYWFENHVFK